MVPRVDGGDGQSQIAEVLFGQVRANLLINGIGNVPAGNEGESLSPSQGGTLTV